MCQKNCALYPQLVVTGGPFLENLQMDFLIAGWKWPQLDKGGVTVAKKEGGKKKDGGCQMA